MNFIVDTIQCTLHRQIWHGDTILLWILLWTMWIASTRCTLYSDLPGWEAQGGGVITPAICVTNLKPDSHTIWAQDDHAYSWTHYTSQHEHWHKKQRKTQKYTPFIADKTGFQCDINCFDVRSTVFILARNKSTLLELHNLLRKGLKKTTCFDNLNSLAWYGSQKVWMTRGDP